MKEKIESLFESLTHSFAYDTIKMLFLLIGSSGLSFTGFFNLLNQTDMSTWCAVVLSCSIALLISFAIVVVYQLLSNQYTRAEKINSDYDIIEKIITLKYNGKKSFYNLELKLKFNNKTREYYGKFYWSGSGDVKVESVNRNYKVQILRKRTRFTEYVIVFDRAYKKGQKLRLKIRLEMNDPDGTFVPYFATTVNSPMKNLKIILDVDPQQYPIDELERDIIPPTCALHENCEEVKLDVDGVYTWEISHPVLTYQYVLTWVFKT